MKRVNLVLRPTDIPIIGDTIGVDSGALYCLDKNIDMLLALGDFDSITKEDLVKLETSGVRVIKFPEDKNEIDFELALNYVDDYDEIYVYGGLGNRRDHEYMLMNFVMRDPRIVVIDKENRIQMREKGEYNYTKSNYKFLSIIPLSDGVISLSGFKYPLYNVEINKRSFYLTSNQIVDKGIITLSKGKILVIEST